MSTVIKVENLSKRYYLSHRQKENFPTLRDAIMLTASNVSKRLTRSLRTSSCLPLEGINTTEEFWALNDVSFEVKQGDRLGIIGRNGAGKSTLLKILSRITEPTKGRVSIKGRTASLLEVGTGFHPELTGRENIFLNGAILGMSRVEIRRKFDEIVDFAEIEKFLDTPVKRYSSGMYVRLAFAVAAHLEPEILIVDEVLAVGDSTFQKKCLGKMQSVSGQGRTVLFVSHNMSAVLNMCNKGVFLNRGQVVLDSEIDKVVNSYVLSVKAANMLGAIESNYIEKFEIVFADKKKPSINLGESLSLRIKTKDFLSLPNVHIGLAFINSYGQKVCSFTSAMQNGFGDMLTKGQEEFHVEIPHLPLIPGSYSIELSVVQRGISLLECHNNAGEFTVLEGDFYGTGRELTINDGFFFVDGKWC